MNGVLLRTVERRVGIVGVFAAGKTVLLTSAINHLEHHDPDRFRLGAPPATGWARHLPFGLAPHAGPVALRKFRAVPPSAGWPAFPYATCRDALVNQGRWPRKTFDRSEFACRFERSDWGYSDAKLRLLDFPGERLADAAMLGRTYAEWADHWHAVAAADTQHQTANFVFLSQLERPESTREELLQAYRLALATTILPPHYKPYVSPSVFLLDTRGQLARGTTPEEVAAGRLLGVSEAEPFCPLPAAVRAKQPQLVAAFTQAYDRYQAEVVTPYLRELRGCHSLVVMVDVLAMLAGGVGVCNDHRQILADLFGVLDPGESLVGNLGRRLTELLIQYRPPGITRVAFVAPKVDLVHPADRDKVLHLLKRFVGKLASDRDGLAADYFNCAAVRSTRALAAADPERTLAGLPYRDAEGRRQPPGVEHRFHPSAVPDEWPAFWRAGDFQFPEVYPAVPALKSLPPDHINLDRVVNFILD